MSTAQSLNAAPELGRHFSRLRLKKNIDCSVFPQGCVQPSSHKMIVRIFSFSQAPQQTLKIVAALHEVQEAEVQAVAEVLVVAGPVYVASTTQHPCVFLRKV